VRNAGSSDGTAGGRSTQADPGEDPGHRGAAGWWILVGQRLGVSERELSSATGARLQAATASGLLRSPSLGRALKVAGVLAFVLLVLIPLLGALLVG
jgi:hypothetical protein